MPKKHTRLFSFNKIFKEKELKEHVDSELENLAFKRHCAEVASNLNIDVKIVEDVLKDNSFQVLSLLQDSVLKEKEIRINIIGFIYFETIHIKYVFKKMMMERSIHSK